MAMLLTLTTALALAQTEPSDLNEVCCLLPEGCEPVPEDELLCLLPEGCDANRDCVPDLSAGQSVPGDEASTVQYDSIP